MSERTGYWVNRVSIRRVCDDVDLTPSPPECVVPEPNGAVGEPLPVGGPVWLAPPAVVDRVSGKTCGLVGLG